MYSINTILLIFVSLQIPSAFNLNLNATNKLKYRPPYGQGQRPPPPSAPAAEQNPIIVRPEDESEFYKTYCPHCKNKEQSPCKSSAWNLGTLYRYYNAELQDHLYTMDYGKYRAGKHGYLLQDSNFQIFRSPETNTVPLFEYQNPKTGKHFYGTENRQGRGHSHEDSDPESGHMYKLKGLIGYLFDRMSRAQGTVSLSHYLLDKGIQDNVYTINPFEFVDDTSGYEFIDVTGYVCPVPRAP